MSEWIDIKKHRPLLGQRVVGYWPDPVADTPNVQVATLEEGDRWEPIELTDEGPWDLGPPTHWLPCPPDPEPPR